MTIYQLNEVLEGCGLVEHLGNLFEIIGMEGDKYILSDVNDGHPLFVQLDRLMTDEYEFVG